MAVGAAGRRPFPRGLLAFMLVLFLVGHVVFVSLIVRVAVEWWRLGRYASTPGRVYATDVLPGGRAAGFFPVVWYRYQVGGAEYTGSRERIVGRHEATTWNEVQDYFARMQAGPVEVWYDPVAPGRAVLDKTVPGGVVVALVMLTGITGLAVVGLGVGVVVNVRRRRMLRGVVG